MLVGLHWPIGYWNRGTDAAQRRPTYNTGLVLRSVVLVIVENY